MPEARAESEDSIRSISDLAGKSTSELYSLFFVIIGVLPLAYILKEGIEWKS